jgi:hypothetical protein
MVPGQIWNLPPKAPPTKGANTRTFVLGTENRSARWVRNQSMDCVASWTVRRSPSQTAMVECGSSALWLCCGVVYRRSSDTCAVASAASASPLVAPRGKNESFGCGCASCSDPSKSTEDLVTVYSARTSAAASRAAAEVSATTTAIGCPSQCTSSLCR